MSKGCKTQGRGPRSAAKPLLVQAGWRELKRGDITTREPIMIWHTTEWMTKHPDGAPLLCGYIRKEGDHQSPKCVGCENEVKP